MRARLACRNAPRAWSAWSGCLLTIHGNPAAGVPGGGDGHGEPAARTRDHPDVTATGPGHGLDGGQVQAAGGQEVRGPGGQEVMLTEAL
jgi:hypothetical protein